MHRLRTRLIAVFFLATLAPLALTIWLVRSLIDRSFDLTATRELDHVSRSLEVTGRELYRRARLSLQTKPAPDRVVQAPWPQDLAAFATGNEPERFELTGPDGDHLRYLVRQGPRIAVYEESLGPVGLSKLARQYSEARAQVEKARERDWRGGFFTTFLVLASATWLLALALLVYLTHRIAQPIQQLAGALRRFGQGEANVRVPVHRLDEIGQAIDGFNDMAAQLERNRERFLFVARLESWQMLARKMAHEVKNSLTPIRLTVEEMVARHGSSDPAFLKQAAQIVADEVTGLERRVRAFSDLASEPPVHPAALDVNALLEERMAFLKSGHPEVSYQSRLDSATPRAWADEDLVRGILTNLMENAAQAAPAILSLSQRLADGRVAIEVHDSGPGLSPTARQSLFEPTISFKKSGMGLGLSIARKSALLNRGDIELIDSELGGAAFRVILPAVAESS
ncbi:MAG: HAMP domain-containing histidine kinase [Bryobacteraceae bacterium]|nr:HAMP domain-containing histidine kinase [Bryobacteraceae bacterium]